MFGLFTLACVTFAAAAFAAGYHYAKRTFGKPGDEQGKKFDRPHNLPATILESLPIMAFVKDAKNLKFVHFNKVARVLTGLTESDLIGKSDYDFFPKEQAEFFVKKDREVLKGKVAINIPEEPLTSTTGEVRFLHTRKVPLLDESGKPEYLLGISEDITEQKRTLTALTELKEAADRANRAKSEFLANMSHEIRTPMNAIVGMTSLILDSPLTPQQKEHLTIVQDAAQSLLTIINDVLDFSKIEANKLTIEPAPFNPRQLANRLLSLLRFRSVEKQIDWEVEVAESIPDMLIGDEVRIRQILLNVIGNAIKFTPAGGDVSLRLDCVAHGPEAIELIAQVRDTGIGIPADKLELIFEPFQQADSSTTRLYGGTGLGLSIARRLVEIMSGQLTVTSTVNVGSTFELRLPLQVHASLIRNARALTTVVANSPSTVADHLHVLVVEDNPINQRFTKQILENEKCQVSVVTNGLEAVEMVKNTPQPFDIIFMDCQMPVMNGYDATRIIREMDQEKNTHVPIIGMTASNLEEDKVLCLKCGMDEYMPKPFDLKALRVLIGKFAGV